MRRRQINEMRAAAASGADLPSARPLPAPAATEPPPSPPEPSNIEEWLPRQPLAPSKPRNPRKTLHLKLDGR